MFHSRVLGSNRQDHGHRVRQSGGHHFQRKQRRQDDWNRETLRELLSNVAKTRFGVETNVGSKGHAGNIYRWHFRVHLGSDGRQFFTSNAKTIPSEAIFILGRGVSVGAVMIFREILQDWWSEKGHQLINSAHSPGKFGQNRYQFGDRNLNKILFRFRFGTSEIKISILEQLYLRIPGSRIYILGTFGYDEYRFIEYKRSYRLDFLIY